MEREVGSRKTEDDEKRATCSLCTGNTQRSSGLYHDRAPFTEPDISPLCGSGMKYSSPSFITQVKIHPCDGTARGERERGCVVISYLGKKKLLTPFRLL